MARLGARKQQPVYPPGESPQEKLDAEARRTYGMNAEEFVTALEEGVFAEQYDNNDPDFLRVFALMGPYLDARPAPEYKRLSPKEMRQHFEDKAQRWLSITGDEFVRKWEAGEFGDFDRDPEMRGKVWPVAFLLSWYYDYEDKRRKKSKNAK